MNVGVAAWVHGKHMPPASKAFGLARQVRHPAGHIPISNLQSVTSNQVPLGVEPQENARDFQPLMNAD
jgi:hypothetical protein